MTIYHFKRDNKGFVNRAYTAEGYLSFLGFAFVCLVLHIINIPSFFGGNYHLFLLDLGLFYLICEQKHKVHFFTIFLIYLLMDVLEGGLVGISFLGFLITIFPLKFFLNQASDFKKTTLILGAFIFLFTISSMRLLGFYLTIENASIINTLKPLTKSILYSTILFTNFLLICKK